jgi:hypothetical protein
MNDPAELSIVELALKCGVTGCVVWNPRQAERVRKELAKHRITPELILIESVKFVQSGGAVLQAKETRPEYDHRVYYYKVIVPFASFANGLFVEMELTDPDPEVPTVTLVNAHEQL